MRADDGQVFTWSSAGTSSSFYLVGGLYLFAGLSGNWNGGNAQVQMLGPDGSTFMNVGTDLTANGSNTMYLPPGTYQFVITTTAAGSVSLGRVPND